VTTVGVPQATVHGEPTRRRRRCWTLWCCGLENTPSVPASLGTGGRIGAAEPTL